MMTREDLESYAKSTWMSTWQAEKDLVQHLILGALYEVSTGEFVFKGGTALQKCMGSDRFSADLDFTWAGKSESEYGHIDRTRRRVDKVYVTKAALIEKGPDSVTYELVTEGPLFDPRKPQSVQKTVINLSTREELLGPAKLVHVVPQFTIASPYLAKLMSPEEMLAEKVRAIMTRDKARDVYDLYFLLNKNVRLVENLAERKLAFYGREFSVEGLREAIKTRNRLWKEELRILLPRVPDFEEVRENIEKRTGEQRN